ncbi:MAG TPA: glycosyltransferase [Bryobacteraceae bacterium]|nr:glycosyltransferase [Bryobacteraceae bacterium]
MAGHILLGILAIPFIYYVIVLYSSWRFFHQPPDPVAVAFHPPVSILKPFRGLDPGAYENLASFCRQDYPDYEVVLCIDPDNAKVRQVVEQVRRDFPERSIRVLLGSGRVATNDKVAKLARLVGEAHNEIVVISDSDVRVRPDYLQALISPLSDPCIGAVTCFYVHADVNNFADRLQTVGMISDFYAGILVAWQLDGIKFALGPSIATTRARLAGFGGYASIENRPADDLLVGRLIAEQGHEVKLLRYSISTVSDYHSVRDLVHKRLRWIVVMRHMRPWGHLGLLFTHGLPWSVLAVIVQPSIAVAVGYLGGYLAIRSAITWVIGARGLHQPHLWRQIPLIPLWDALAFMIWLASFAQSSVRWRGADYYIRDGQLVPVASPAIER